MLKQTLRRVVVALRRSSSERRLLLLLWVVNLLCALPLAVPLWAIAGAQFGGSRAGHDDPFIPGELTFELGHALASHVAPLAGAAALAMVLAILANQLLAGGVVARLWHRGRPSREGFAADCVRYFWRNLRVWLWMLLALIPAIVVSALTRKLLGKLEANAAEVSSFEKWNVLRMGIVVLLIAAWRAAFDLARTLVVVEDSRVTRRAAWRAVKLVVRRPALVLGYCAVAAVALALLAVLAAIHARLPQVSTVGALIVLVVGQLVILGRQWGSLATSSFIVESWRELAGTPPVRARTMVEAELHLEEEPVKADGVENDAG